RDSLDVAVEERDVDSMSVSRHVKAVAVENAPVAGKRIPERRSAFTVQTRRPADPAIMHPGVRGHIAPDRVGEEADFAGAANPRQIATEPIAAVARVVMKTKHPFVQPIIAVG